jgi:hypothetical protein
MARFRPFRRPCRRRTISPISLATVSWSRSIVGPCLLRRSYPAQEVDQMPCTIPRTRCVSPFLMFSTDLSGSERVPTSSVGPGLHLVRPTPTSRLLAAFFQSTTTFLGGDHDWCPAILRQRCTLLPLHTSADFRPGTNSRTFTYGYPQSRATVCGRPFQGISTGKVLLPSRQRVAGNGSPQRQDCFGSADTCYTSLFNAGDARDHADMRIRDGIWSQNAHSMCRGMFSADDMTSCVLTVQLARAGGLAEPLPSVSTASDLDSLWHQFVRVESHKRTFFTLYQFDVMWYHILSIPRIISHLEIKLELPCTQDMWTATTSSEWAHRSLTSGKSIGASTRYIQAVRTFMSPNPAPCTATLDAHGSLLIILFLLSSVREQSGWSTMTGRVSFERFEVSSSLSKRHMVSC